MKSITKFLGLSVLFFGLQAEGVQVGRTSTGLVPVTKSMELGKGVRWSNGETDFTKYHRNTGKLAITGKCFWKTKVDKSKVSMCIKVTQSGYTLGKETRHTTDIKKCPTGSKCTYTIPKSVEASLGFIPAGKVTNLEDDWSEKFLDLFPALASRKPLKANMKFKIDVDGKPPKVFWFRPVYYEIKATLNTTYSNKKTQNINISGYLPIKLKSGAIDAIYGA